jgi:hypothetical protein
MFFDTKPSAGFPFLHLQRSGLSLIRSPLTRTRDDTLTGRRFYSFFFNVGQKIPTTVSRRPAVAAYQNANT